MPTPTRRRLAATVAAAAVAAAGSLAACTDHGTDAAAQAGGAVAEPAPLVVLPDAELAARFGAATWRVETDGCGWVGSGSAFAVDAHHLVTNHHVIATDVGPDLVSADGGRRISGEVIGMSAAADVAVIETEETLPVTVAWAPTEAVAVGERILAFGYPQPSYAFTISWGHIVEFLDAAPASQAMLTNAPIDKGNSGGPAVRGDGTVAGIVTQMRVGGTGDHAAIVFTTAAVQPLVAGFIVDPQDVVSDCGFGPDYVPPVPETLTLPAELPPPPASSTTTPLSPPTTPRRSSGTTAPPVTSRPTSTTAVPCPSGAAGIGDVSFQAEPAGDETTWNITIDAVVTNDADAALVATNATAVVEGTTIAELDADFAEPFTVDAGASAPVRIEGTVTSDSEPALRRVDLAYSWGSAQHRYCSTPPAFAEF